MICNNCGAQIADNSKFCQGCGAPVNPQPQFNQPFGQMPSQGIEKRDIAITIILSIVTCGIYGLVWLARMTDDLNKISNRTDDFSGGVVVLLTLLTGGLFAIYWAYKAGDKLNEAKAMRGIPTDNNASILYMILYFVGLGIVTDALVQSELNKFAD